jgi:hypothetical protein
MGGERFVVVVVVVVVVGEWCGRGRGPTCHGVVVRQVPGRVLRV